MDLRFLLAIISGALAGTALAADPMPAPTRTEPFAEFVSPQDSLPQLRFLADDKLSLNDRCPVRRVRLNPRMGAHYVNGQPVGFC